MSFCRRLLSSRHSWDEDLRDAARFTISPVLFLLKSSITGGRPSSLFTKTFVYARQALVQRIKGGIACVHLSSTERCFYGCWRVVVPARSSCTVYARATSYANQCDVATTPTVSCRDVATFLLSSTTLSDAGDDHQALPHAQLLVVSILKCFTKPPKHSRTLFWWPEILRAVRCNSSGRLLWKISITGGRFPPSISPASV
ncbi:hypothetical protein R3P38DRAFT_3204588 [Favolaschia claudopus]|uniref:Uncharacterized protein n=1 Tax=Favolaschia claudopus TaxID=2862362 RepID=A0AAW0AQJ5_9AGAR